MARKKKDIVADPPGAEPEGVVFGARKPIAVSVPGSREWKEWVASMAKANRQTVAGLIDTALAAYARTVGFRDPPER